MNPATIILGLVAVVVIWFLVVKHMAKPIGRKVNQEINDIAEEIKAEEDAKKKDGTHW